MTAWIAVGRVPSSAAGATRSGVCCGDTCRTEKPSRMQKTTEGLFGLTSRSSRSDHNGVVRLVVTGVVAGVLLGYALQRSKLSLHTTWAGLPDGRWIVFRTWLLGVMIGVLGLTAIYASGAWSQLNEGLPLRPFPNALGGLLLGIGLVLALTSASGLFYNLGAGSVTCVVGIAGFTIGDAVGGWFELPGHRAVLDAGEGATLPGWLGVPHWVVAVPLALVVIGLLVRWRPGARDRPELPDQWPWLAGGAALGLTLVGAWALAGIGGHDFGPNTEGAVSSLLRGDPNRWEGAFVLALVPGAFVAAGTTGALRFARSHAGRLARLLLGGIVLGLGGQIAGGCHLGHGLSGVAQLGIGSWLVAASIVAGVVVGRRFVEISEEELAELGPLLG